MNTKGMRFYEVHDKDGTLIAKRHALTRKVAAEIKKDGQYTLKELEK